MLVMGVSAYMDYRLAVTGPPFAVVQIWHQSIMIDGVVLGHDLSFLKNIKGCLRGVQTIQIHTPLRISVFDLLLDLLEGDRVHWRFTVRDAEELCFEFIRFDLEEPFGE